MYSGMYHYHRPRFYAHAPHYIPYETAVNEIQDGWLAQFRGTSLIAKSIQKATGGPHNHSGLLARSDSGVDVLEVREFQGGRRISLFDYLNTRGVEIDIFRIDIDRFPEFKDQAAVEHMAGIVEGPTAQGYSYTSIGRIFLRKVPLVWHLFRGLSTDDQLSRGNMRAFCSEAVATAHRVGGGVDPVPRLPDHWVDPNMLTRSLLYAYYGTVKG